MDSTTADALIIKRRWLLVDCDPVRPVGISATDREKEAAWERCEALREWLAEHGLPAPVVADSGNGFHLLYRVDLPNDTESHDLVKRCLEALAYRFDDERVTVDTSVFNAARIIKLYGTLSVKGDDTRERPHRRSSLEAMSQGLRVVGVSLLHDLAALAPKPQTETLARSGQFDLQDFISRGNLQIARVRPWQGGMLHELEACPFDPEHKRTARIIAFANGALAFGCFHNSCQGRDWHALRELVEPGAKSLKPTAEQPQTTKTLAKPKGRNRTKKAEDERKTRKTSFLVSGPTLFEQIHVSGRSMFVAYDTTNGEVRQITGIELADETLEPIDGEDMELGAVKLPSGVEEYGDTPGMLAEIESHVYKYLDVSPSYMKFAAYYILLSWLYDRFSTLPYLRALGDTGCGKSRFLDVIGGLCYKAISASGCVTPAPIYRMIRKWGGTLILDEADMKNTDEYNEVITILNCGFERGRPVLRATKDQPDKIQVLPVYGPKVFATRRRFQDVALEARCLTEIMRETDRSDIPPVLGRKFLEEQQRLRNKLLLFRLRKYVKVDPEAGANIILGNTEPRLRQVSESFLSLFANEEKVLASYQQFILGHQRELIEQRAATKVGQVVEALFDLMEGNEVTVVTSIMGDSLLNVTPKELAEKVGISPQAVGQILKNLGLSTKLTKVSGTAARRIIFDSAKFAKLEKRYIVKDDAAAEVTKPLSPISNVTNVTHVTGENTGQGAAKQEADGLACIKGVGMCILRQGEGEFQCSEVWERCRFRHPANPDPACGACGCNDFWLTDWGKWLCWRCHPKPL